MANNTYKAVRVVGEDYSLYYSVWCDGDHELYDMAVCLNKCSPPYSLCLLYLTRQSDPHQMTNLLDHPTTNTILDRSIARTAQRLDTLMLLLKSCKGADCIKPWAKIHPEGNVNSLAEAMSPDFDRFYDQQPRVRFDRCEDAYIPELEGPQRGYEYRDGLAWHHWV